MATDMKIDEDVGEGFVLDGVPWAVYRALRKLDENRGVRMSYLDGTLILMSPQYIHEWSATELGHLIIEVSGALDIVVEPTRTTTLRLKGRRKRRGVGKEPDEGFYVGANAETMRHKETINLAIDPPPDLAIEVDNKGDSKASLPIYARLGVPEVWRFSPRERRLWFGRLEEKGYESIGTSLAIPALTPGLVLEALDVRVNEKLSLYAWKTRLAGWARSLPRPPETL